jgi:hypothetical protein
LDGVRDAILSDMEERTWRFWLATSVGIAGVAATIVFGVLQVDASNGHEETSQGIARSVSTPTQAPSTTVPARTSTVPSFTSPTNLRPSTASRASSAVKTFSVPVERFTDYTRVVKVGGSLVTFHGAVAEHYDGYQFGPTTCNAISITAGIDDASASYGPGTVEIYTEDGTHSLVVPTGRLVKSKFHITGKGNFRLHSVLNYVYFDGTLTCSTPDGT